MALGEVVAPGDIQINAALLLHRDSNSRRNAWITVDKEHFQRNLHRRTACRLWPLARS